MAPALPTSTDDKKVYYEGGWKPTPTINKHDPDAPPAHNRISNYNVIVNDDLQYTWSINPHVNTTYDITKVGWSANAEERKTIDVRVDGQNLIIVKESEEVGIFRMLP